MSVDVVLIGRNEGDRLVNSLASVVPQARRVVYVDSGSTDDSVANARRVGAEVVNLDMSVPFTAARARNEGFQALTASGDAPDAVQFLDGDCIMADGWLAKGQAWMAAHDDLGLVTGQAAEMRRDATVYNQMFDVEWKRPAGDILACSGNMMVRTRAFDAVGGFDPTVIAAEDDEFCTRLRKAGWRLERIPEDMARHDANMTRFSQWWKRAERTGHGFAQVGHLHPDYFVRERQRALVYGAFLPFMAIAGAFMSPAVPVLILGVYALSYTRTAKGLMQDGLPRSEALHHAIYLTLSKFPNVIGMIRYHWRRLTQAQMRIIEYK
ncbi:glycosyltransferase [Marivita sp. S6314]|uniref:glycosyltransferase n=1 Tax=Marivita sp. S6314 TaxID=2926406 RepID=UPI001FF26D5C|nr:glycosyltransferase [Marivita sp. S6314]MCK0151695.1 glycosyltransferase [Marivita sp. S6314]